MAMQFSPKMDEVGSKGLKASVSNATLAAKVPKSAKYMAVFRINDNVVERVYTAGEKEGNGIQVLTASDFSGDTLSASYTIQFNNIGNKQLQENDVFAVVFFTDKAGYMAYSTILDESTENRVEFEDSNLMFYKTSKDGTAKHYVDTSAPYVKGDVYTLINAEPVDSKGEYKFLGWLDKAATNYSARILLPGAGTPHSYNTDSDVRTLDALWIKYKAKNTSVSEFYNGKTHEQEEEFSSPTNLPSDLADTLSFKDSTIAWYDESNNEIEGAPVNVGTYKQTFSKTVTIENVINGVKETAIERSMTTDSSVTIKERNVTISSEDLIKVYDGTPLVSTSLDDVNVGATMKAKATDNGDGWVEGEGINPSSINFTGSQTQIGKSSNTFTYTANSKTDFSNYNITEVFGTLEVKPRYQVEYYYNNVKAEDETIIHEMAGKDYYEVGNIVKVSSEETPKIKGYKLSNVENEKLTLTDDDEANIIKVYYVSVDESKNPLTLDNISKYIFGLFVGIFGIFAGLITHKKFSRK